MSLRCSVRMALAAGAVVVCTGAASAASITSGLYRLHNHPDGNSVPPPYGAKFDELYDATSGHDTFTLNFDDSSSAAYMLVDLVGAKIRIYGSSFGGRDIGGDYAFDAYRGTYTFDFLYDVGVQSVPGDDDVWTAMPDPGHVNFGYIQTPLGDSITLTDEAMGGYSVRVGDEDNDLGHRGYPGISVWGWMSYVTGNGINHVADTDWLCTAELVPAPSTLGLIGAGALFASRRRR